MSYTSDSLVSTLGSGPNRRVLRAIGYLFLLVVASTDVLVGASPWVAYFGVLGVACVATYLLPSKPSTPLRNWFAGLIARLYSWPLRYQMAAALAAFVAIEALDYHVGGFRLGRIFNIYMAAVFSHALVFGLRSSLLMWLFATLTVYFAEIPPEYSFKLNSLTEFVDIFIFMYVGLLALASAYLLRLSSVASDQLDERR